MFEFFNFFADNSLENLNRQRKELVGLIEQTKNHIQRIAQSYPGKALNTKVKNVLKDKGSFAQEFMKDLFEKYEEYKNEKKLVEQQMIVVQKQMSTECCELKEMTLADYSSLKDCSIS